MIAIPGFVVYGPPRTKKNSGKIISIPKPGSRKCFACGHRPGFPKIIPSDAHEAWKNEALHQMIAIRMKLAARGVSLPIAGLVSIEALIYRHAEVGDVCGFEQAIGDMLQEARVIFDDKQIEDWDGTRRLKDAINPRVEVYITVVEPRAVQMPLEGAAVGGKATHNDDGRGHEEQRSGRPTRAS